MAHIVRKIRPQYAMVDLQDAIAVVDNLLQRGYLDRVQVSEYITRDEETIPALFITTTGEEQ